MADAQHEAEKRMLRQEIAALRTENARLRDDAGAVPKLAARAAVLEKKCARLESEAASRDFADIAEDECADVRHLSRRELIKVIARLRARLAGYDEREDGLRTELEWSKKSERAAHKRAYAVAAARSAVREREPAPGWVRRMQAAAAARG